MKAKGMLSLEFPKADVAYSRIARNLSASSDEPIRRSAKLNMHLRKISENLFDNDAKLFHGTRFYQVFIRTER